MKTATQETKMNETAIERLRQDVRELRAEGFPISRLQLNYMAKVTQNAKVASCRIIRYGAPRDENGERIVENSWVQLRIKYAGRGAPSWRASRQDSYLKTLGYTADPSRLPGSKLHEVK